MSEDINDAAARWLSEQNGDDMDWDGFTRWLETDPRHRAAFDTLALLDDDVTTHRASIAAALPGEEAATDRPRSWRKVGLAWIGAVATALVLFFGAHGNAPTPGPVLVATTPGQTREVGLRDGSRIVLAPASRLMVMGENQDRIAMTGSAYFDVVHRQGRDLVIEANGLSIRDVGTKFAVDAGAAATRVSVAQGEVEVSIAGAGDGVMLRAGRGFVLARGDASAQLSAVRAADVGSWRRGELVYDAAPLALVADDLNRYARQRVAVDPRIADRRFSGVLSIGDGAALAKSVAAIMALRVRSVDGGVRLEPGGKR